MYGSVIGSKWILPCGGEDGDGLTVWLNHGDDDHSASSKDATLGSLSNRKGNRKEPFAESGPKRLSKARLVHPYLFFS